MKHLHDLRGPKGATRDRKRVARGNGTGKGGKGQTMRSGKGKPRRGFEGGQMQMYRRLPKRGFTNKFALLTAEMNLDMLARHFGPNSVVDLNAFKAAGLTGGRTEALRILGRGELKFALTIRGAHVTRGAREKIEAAGGKVESTSIEAAG